MARRGMLERLIETVSPAWALKREQARLMVRHFDAAASSRRTNGWHRRPSDANAAASGPTLAYLRAQSRDLVRNNPWARRALRRIVSSTIGWGIRPKATGAGAAEVMRLFGLWGETPDCDADGRLTFFGLQRLIMRTVVESGEVLVRRRRRLLSDGYDVPLQFQVIEPDFLDASRDNPALPNGGKIVGGVEFDAVGSRAAYWLFSQHPGGTGMVEPVSRRIDADGILHIYDQERAGQVRGVPWFASVDLRLHDFDEFEDATLMKQKIAACLAAFVTDPSGDGNPLGEASKDQNGELIDTLEPGMVVNLPNGKQVTQTNPPASADHAAYSATALRGVAAGVGCTYEDLTGDYSQVNYSSARMARLAFYGDVHDWRWNMIIPQFCAVAWGWMIDAMIYNGAKVERAPAEWTPPPMPLLDPGAEIKATTAAVRSGLMTPDEAVREQGYDPDKHWREYAANLKRLDRDGIVLDSDPRRTTAGGQMQVAPAAAPTASPAATTIELKPANGVNGAAKA